MVMIVGQNRLEWFEAKLDTSGTATGFNNFRNTVKRCLEMRGVSFDQESLYRFSATPLMALLYTKNLFHPSKRNYLFTMWEANQIPDKAMEQIRKADVVIVPCEHNQQAFLDAHPFPAKVELCKLGFDTDAWPYKEREWNQDETFWFMFAGNPTGVNDKRKGWEVVANAFEKAFKPSQKIGLYVKLSTNPWGKDQKLREYYGGRFIVDNRFLPHEELVKIYHKCHAFVFPSRGEGAGLTPMEAMATGMLVLAPPVTGMADYISMHTGIPLPYDFYPLIGKFGCAIDIYNVDEKKLIKKMKEAMSRYNSDVMRFRRKAGADFIRRHHSLECMADGLMNTIFGMKPQSEAVAVA